MFGKNTDVYVFLPIWDVHCMPSYSFSKSKGHVLRKDLGITERGRDTDHLEKCFTALYSKDRTEEDL